MDALRTLKALAASGACMLCLGSLAQTTTKASGSFSGFESDGSSLQGMFTCTGSPTCAGTYNAAYHDAGCANSVVVVDDFIIAGFDLSHPGPVQGQVTIRKAEFQGQNINGVCSIVPGTSTDKTFPYSGTWSGTTGSLVIAGTDGPVDVTFSATLSAPVPPFPMRSEEHTSE